MGMFFGIAYFVGFVGAVVVGRYRAGISQMGRLPTGLMLKSLPWVAHQVTSFALWPVFLGVWLARGRPESPWELVGPVNGSGQVRRRQAPDAPRLG